jgi:O-antigen/teichoic acid export membrane protein
MFLYVHFFKKDITHFFTDLPEATSAKIFGFIAQISFSIFALFFWGLLLRIDQFLLAYFTNAHTIGLYAAAVKAAEMPNALAGVVTSALTSRIALLPTIGKNEIRRRFKIIVGSQAVVGGFISLAFIIFAPVIVSVLYGQAFSGSIAILQVYALTIPFMFMNYVFHSMYGSFSLIKVQALNYFLALLINSVLGVIGFLLYGIFGVIFATVIAYAFCTIFTIGYMYKTILK